ncbi:MAG: hypothetical protein P4L87_12490 [Formivibrio sp.]|nr:hypothetical protein [Formivibrio sp.]
MNLRPARILAILISLVLAGSLAACERGSQLAEQAASATAAQVKNEASSVLSSLNVAASAVAGRIRESDAKPMFPPSSK